MSTGGALYYHLMLDQSRRAHEFERRMRWMWMRNMLAEAEDAEVAEATDACPSTMTGAGQIDLTGDCPIVLPDVAAVTVPNIRPIAVPEVPVQRV